MSSITKVLLLGGAFHILMLNCMFEIYFRSPILRDLEYAAAPADPPAERVVLFVGTKSMQRSIFDYNTCCSGRAASRPDV